MISMQFYLPKRKNEGEKEEGEAFILVFSFLLALDWLERLLKLQGTFERSLKMQGT